jgi:hypothetical protein
MDLHIVIKNEDGSLRRLKPQVFFAVYDSDVDSDYFAYDTLAEAVSEVEGWLLTGLVENLKNDEDLDLGWSGWGRLYVCSVDADTVPTEYTDGWMLWEYEDDAINYRRMFASWGDHGMTDISR